MKTDAAHPKTCPECGRPLPPDSPRGMCPRCLVAVVLDASPEPPAALGTVGDYDLLEVIGHGGMGMVYRARQRRLHREVALKMLLGGHFAEAQARGRFRDEAELAAQLQHPHIVAIHDVGEHEGLPYFTMDLVTGCSLAELARDQPLPPNEAATHLKTIAEAVQYAHDRGVLHRDLKPSNILIDGFDQPRITDFGLARRIGGTKSDFTVTGQTLGSPNFMPPEQAAGRHHQVGPASDVYGLGAILYYLLTSRPPFLADNLGESVRQVQEDDPVSPRILNPSLPRDLETICLKCLQKDPGQRYGTARELAEELGRFLRGEPILARPVGRVMRTWRWCRRRPAVAALLAALMVVIGIAAVRILHSQQETAQQRYYASLTLAQRHLEEGAPDLAMEVLLQCPEALRHWEWGHLVAECHREVLTLTNAIDPTFRNSEVPSVLQPVWRCQFSPDNRQLAAVNPAGRVWIWEIPSGRVVWQWSRPAHHVANVTLSPNWKDLAMTTTNGVDVLPVGGSEPRLRLEVEGAPVRVIAFSPDGRTLATLAAREVRLWAVEDGVTKGSFAVPAEVETLSFTPDGERLIAASVASASVHAVATGQVVRELSDPSGETVALIADPFAERYVTFNQSNRFRLWSTNGLVADLGVLRAANVQGVRKVVFSPDGLRFCTAGDHNTAAVRDARTGSILMPIPNQVYGLVLSPDGQALATSGGNTIVRIWDLNTSQGFLALRGHTDNLHDLTFSPDGRLLATMDASGLVKLWSARAGRELVTLPGIPWALSQSRDGQLAAVVPVPYGLRIWELQSGKVVADLGRHRRWVYSSSFSPDGEHVATGGTPGEACIWNFKTGQLVHVLKGHSNAVWVTYSPDGRRLLSTGFDGVARIWDPGSGAELRTFRGDQTLISGSGFSPDGRQLVTGGNDATVRVWEVETGKCLRVLRGHTNWVIGTFFSPDGTSIASTGIDRTLRLWNVRTGKQTACWNLRGHALVFDFSPDGRRIVLKTSTGATYASDHPITEIRDVQTGQSIIAFRGHAEGGGMAQFSPDGRRLFTDWWDWQIRQWETFPWHDREYPGSTSLSLAERIQLYAGHYWAERLAAESTADQGSTGPVVWLPFTGADLPARDPSTPVGCLDLTDHYTGTLNMISHMNSDVWLEGDYLQPLPKGAVQFGGVDFDVRGVIQLTLRTHLGPLATLIWADYPERVESIPVRRSFAR
ncbi:MAG: protein kinase domain-containing protein, partial [Limisphaerales bacterium]